MTSAETYEIARLLATWAQANTQNATLLEAGIATELRSAYARGRRDALDDVRGVLGIEGGIGGGDR